MAHVFEFTVRVTTERDEGKFASRDEQADAIREILEQSDPGSLDGIGADGTSTYSITEWEVEESQK